MNPTNTSIVSFLEKLHTIEDVIKLDGFACDTKVTTVSSISEAVNGDVTFCNSQKHAHLIYSTMASIVIVESSVELDISLIEHATVIATSENARLDFIRVANEFFAKRGKEGVHHTAVISSKATIGKGVYIGANSVIGNVVIGDGTVIYPCVVIYDNVSIGNNCIIHSGCVVGADGVGFEQNKNGALEKFPHVGGVAIGDNVELQASCCIICGTLGTTVIKRGSKIGASCSVGHNATIGEDCMIINNSVIAGSAVVGDRVYIGPSSVVRNSVSIHNDVFIGMGSIVTKDITDCLSVVGTPAIPIEDYKERLRAVDTLTRCEK